MKKIEFNVNQYIYVKITEVGFKHLRDSYIELCGSDKYYNKPKIDKDGYCEIQLHDFVSKFGNKWWGGSHGSRMPFDTNILIGVES